MSSDYTKVQRAQGYCELGMFEAALEELDAVGDSCRHRPEYQFVRMRVFRESGNWDEIIFYADELMRNAPFSGFLEVWNFHKAYAIYKLEDPQAALRHLLDLANPSEDLWKGCPSSDREETSFLYADYLDEKQHYQYELARYHCLGRDLTSAKRCLTKAIRVDKKTTCEWLVDDEDFDPIWALTRNPEKAKEFVRNALMVNAALDTIGEREGKGWEEYLAAEKALKKGMA